MSKCILPSVRFSLSRYRVCINMSTLAYLGNPLYLHILYDDKRKMLVISTANEEEANSCKIPGRVYRVLRGEYYIDRMALTEGFRARMNWDRRLNYRVTGEYVSDCGVVVFDLKKAIVVGVNEKCGETGATTNHRSRNLGVDG